jgi:2-C-methyl-D-erythritol 4-phosphate cytidylyltransferase
MPENYILDGINKYAVIVAGGSGTRMGLPVPKQYISLGGKPIVMHTIERFYAADATIQIILVLPENDIDFWAELCNKYNFNIPITLAVGGATRYDSVKSGLSYIQQDGLVAIHDAVRPFVTEKIIRESYQQAAIWGNAVTTVALKDSIRVVDDGLSQSTDRRMFRLVQTPQTFRCSVIQQAYKVVANDGELTDDASVAEMSGVSIHTIEGSYTNIKITTPDDLIFAEAICQKEIITEK